MRLDTKVRVWERVSNIKGLESFTDYEVSNLGEVRNTRTRKILKPTVHERNKYLRVFLTGKNGNRKQMRVHRLVALAFIENDNPLEKDQVNHINGDKNNNTVENLEWVTGKENINHAYRTGLHKNAKKQVRKIKCLELDKVFDSASQISRELGIDVSAILDVCRGTYKTMKGYHFEFVD